MAQPQQKRKTWAPVTALVNLIRTNLRHSTVASILGGKLPPDAVGYRWLSQRMAPRHQKGWYRCPTSPWEHNFLAATVAPDKDGVRRCPECGATLFEERRRSNLISQYERAVELGRIKPAIPYIDAVRQGIAEGVLVQLGPTPKSGFLLAVQADLGERRERGVREDVDTSYLDGE